jgi:hypothetical protein
MLKNQEQLAIPIIFKGILFPEQFQICYRV